MQIPEIYDYLVRARRDLWAALEAAPDEALSKPLLDGDRFHCIKDLVHHVASVEDGWIQMDIQRTAPVREMVSDLKEIDPDAPAYAAVPITTLLGYWKAVEQGTLRYLSTLTDGELKRAVPMDDSEKPLRHTVDGLLWHVMFHEARHTAQIAMLLRLQGIKPPSLDLLFYLPEAG